MFVSCFILHIVICSVVQTEPGALFLKIKEGTVLYIALKELGHKQSPTPVHCDNNTATGIMKDSVKEQIYTRWKCDSFG